jgi:endonuclease/exonuclease/phosphatase family metal-dependent hydrolase
MPTSGFTDVLLAPLPPPVQRAIRGFLGPRIVLGDELPPEWRPSANALIEARGEQRPLGSTVTVLSYNVKRAERLPTVTASLSRAVEEHRPDLVLLQEAPLALLRRPGLRRVFADRSLFFAPFHQVERPDRRYPHRQYGQLIASTRRMVSHRVVELPTVNPATLGAGHLMQRIALYAELPTFDGRTLGLVNVHNEPFARRRDRALQHRAFLRVVEDSAPDIAVCCGDFNPTFSQRGEPGIRMLLEHGFENAFARRWRAVDTCLARGHVGIETAARLPLAGSDHRPIVIRLRL